MSRPRHLSERFKKEDFKTLYKRAKGFEQRRYLGLHYVQQGKTYPEVAEMLLVSRLSVIDWVNKYEEGGSGKLRNQKGRGRKARLGMDCKQKFQEKIRAKQAAKAGGRLKASDIVDIALKDFGVQYSISGIYKVLKRMDMVWITGRSIHPKADVEVQETFKKTSLQQ